MSTETTSPSLAEQLAALDEQERQIERRRAEIYRLSIEAPDESKVIEDAFAEMIAGSSELAAKEPSISWRVEYVAWDERGDWFKKNRASGRFVSVRPCAKEHKGKTFLGIMIGDIARSAIVHYRRDARTLALSPFMHNPAIFVPALGEIIFGCASWWGVIESEEHLRTITDEDINSVWYVQALRSLSGKKDGAAGSQPAGAGG
jgi:hypothetical protein